MKPNRPRTYRDVHALIRWAVSEQSREATVRDFLGRPETRGFALDALADLRLTRYFDHLL